MSFKYYYLIRGGFGEGGPHETYLPGTRWVELDELRRNCTKDDVNKLLKFDADLAARMLQAHTDVQAVIEGESSEEEEGGEDEGEEKSGEESESEEELPAAAAAAPAEE